MDIVLPELKPARKGIVLASFVLAIVLGSISPDIDHFVKFGSQAIYGRSYGHIILVPLFILCCLGAAYFGRRIELGVLIKRQVFPAKESGLA